MRHYEILANGCIPYFQDAESVPPGTMVDFPWDIVAEGRRLADNRDDSSEKFRSVIDALLDHTRYRLTTIARARQLLSLTGHSGAETILYLSGDPSPDYLRCLVLHGFKSLFGAACVDACRVPHIYDTFPLDSARTLYGRGFAYTRRIPKAFDCPQSRDELEQRIRNRQFDLVIYGSIHRGRPWWDLIHEAYAPADILVLCGEDIHTCDQLSLGESHPVFIRELGTSGHSRVE